MEKSKGVSANSFKFVGNNRIVVSKKFMKNAQLRQNEEAQLMMYWKQVFPLRVVEESVGNPNKNAHKGLTDAFIKRFLGKQENSNDALLSYQAVWDKWTENYSVSDDVSDAEKRQASKEQRKADLRRNIKARAWFIGKYPKYQDDALYVADILKLKKDNPSTTVEPPTEPNTELTDKAS